MSFNHSIKVSCSIQSESEIEYLGPVGPPKAHSSLKFRFALYTMNGGVKYPSALQQLFTV